MSSTIIPESVFTSSLFYRLGKTNILDEPDPHDYVYAYEQVVPFITDAENYVSSALAQYNYDFDSAAATASGGSASLDQIGQQIQNATIDIALGYWNEYVTGDEKKQKSFRRRGNLKINKLKKLSFAGTGSLDSGSLYITNVGRQPTYYYENRQWLRY